MAQVICTLPNASSLINGVKFIEHEAGVISEEIDDEAAAVFASIKGYIIAGEKAVDEELIKLREDAEALGVKVNSKWGKERLTTEIAKAQSKAANGGTQEPAG
ncbi:MAG: hypothetical protein ACRDRT_12070 [Pseudonocardiaceae bacterium]